MTHHHNTSVEIFYFLGILSEKTLSQYSLFISFVQTLIAIAEKTT